MQTSYQHGPQIVERFMARGPSSAVYPGLWTGCELATLAQPWGGLQARDFARNNHGTLEGGPPWGYGTYRGGAFRAVGFDGTNDVVSGSILGAQTLPFTLSLWAWRSANKNDAGMYESNTSANFAGVRLTIDSVNASNVELRLGDGTGTESSDRRSFITAANTFPLSTWTHIVAVVRSISDADIFINGILQSPATSGTAAAYSAGTGVWQFGKRTGPSAIYFPGSLADVRNYSRALSPAEIGQFTVHPLAAYETHINRYWMFTSSGVAPAPEWVAIPRYGLAAAGLPKYALPRAGVPVAPGVNTWLYARRQSQIIGGGIA